MNTKFGLYRVGKSPWKYYSEYYPQGTKLAMLVLDSHHMYGEGGAIIPTFAWMAEEAGYAFDIYWAEFNDIRFNKWPYFGCRVEEQLLLVNSYFDVLWITLGEHARAMLQPINSLADTLHFDDYPAMYESLMRKWNIKKDEAVYMPYLHQYDQPLEMNRKMIPHDAECASRTGNFMFEKIFRKEAAALEYPIWFGGARNPTPYKEIWNDPDGKAPGFYGRLNFYLWPDVYFSRKLGFTDQTPLSKVVDRFVLKQVDILHTALPEIPPKAKITVVDKTEKTDRAWDLTYRVFRRWQRHAKGITYGIHQNHFMNPHFLGHLIRNRYFSVYDPYWIEYLPKAVKLARQIGNCHFYTGADEWDHFQWPYANLLGVARLDAPATAKIPSIKRAMRFKYLKPERTPWELEISDDELHANMLGNKIAVCYTFGTNELGYAESLPVLYEQIRALRLKIGLGFYLPHIEYFSDWYQKLFTSHLAGCVEPMMHYWGVGAFYPNDNIHHEFTIKDFNAEMKIAESEWVRRMGREYLPIGYLGGQVEYCVFGYPYDTGSYYNSSEYTVMKTGQKADWKDFIDRKAYERFLKNRDAIRRVKVREVKKLGYQYYIGERWNLFDGDFVHVAAQGYHTPKDCLKKIRWKNKAGFFAVKHDLGHTYIPGQLGMRALSKKQFATYSWVAQLETLRWIARGGPQKRFFLVKPNELARYLRLLKAHEKFDDCYEYYEARGATDSNINPKTALF